MRLRVRRNVDGHVGEGVGTTSGDGTARACEVFKRNAGGVLTVVAKEAKFNWDAKKMGDLLDISKFGELTVLERYSYVRH